MAQDSSLEPTSPSFEEVPLAVAAARGDPLAWRSLEGSIVHFSKLGQHRRRLFAELLRGEAEVLAHRATARLHLEKTAAEATERGFVLYARKANESLAQLDRDRPRSH